MAQGVGPEFKLQYLKKKKKSEKAVSFPSTRVDILMPY
jgi:hypothetical protein